MRQQTVKPDIVLFCTGYNQEYPFFTEHNSSLGCKHGKAAKRYAVEHKERDVRGIWNHNDPSVGFIGFLRPSLGAIPPLAEMQAQLWILQLVAPHRISRLPDPADEDHYRLHHPADSRVKYGIDHESYVYQLGLDMDSAMGFTEVLWRGFVDRLWAKGDTKGWTLPLVWAFGANYNVKFRMKGPWRWEGGAEEVMETELWTMIKRRRWFWEHFCLSLLPMMIFGPISLLVWLYATVVGVVVGADLAKKETEVKMGSKKALLNGVKGVEGKWMKERLALEAEL